MSYKISLVAAAAVAAFSSLVDAQVCGSAGYSGSTDSYYYNDSGKQSSYSTCSQLCLKSQACKSFSIGGDTCELFNVAVAGNFDADSTSPYVFYDCACIAAATSSTTVKPSTSTKPSSSSTSGIKTSTSTSTSVKTTTSATSSIKTTSSTTPARPSSSTKSSSSASAPASSGVVVPAGCNVPTSRTVTSFAWFNSTHNCDCAASRPDVGDGTGCLDSNGQWCDPARSSDCTHCGIAVCSTGLPPQPVGYGPPDTVSFSFSDGFSCQQGKPQGFRNFEVGEGHMNCNAGDIMMGFTANSEAATSSGVVSYTQIISCSGGRSVSALYITSFSITCSYDAGHNATCSTPGGTFRMPLVSVT